jgi:Domain of unknown function (DU1801)
MQIFVDTVEEYIDAIPENRKEPLRKLRKVILDNLPEGFEEVMSGGMIVYIVPLTIYPKGYHTTPGLPLPFIGLASQKNNIAVYHMCLYTDPALLKWFREEYEKRSRSRLDMGKSCIRLKKMDEIPYGLFGELVSKISVQKWIDIYDSNVTRRTGK